jgi:glycosyltransferase involved in cell wall biosynthesis
MSQRLSVVIITRDEERDLPACLESVRPLAPEIVLLDSGSTDRTIEVARGYGCRVFREDFEDYASQKQSAVDKSTGEWVLSLDADERLSPALAEEIGRILPAVSAEVAGFEIPYEVRFMGRRLRFGGLGRERHLRLFRRGAGRFEGGRLHEGVRAAGPVRRLNGRIVHVPYRDLDDYLGKLRLYAARAARKRFEAGRRFSAFHHILPFWEVFVRLFLRFGLLDGLPGIAWAGLSSFHTWIKYLMLSEMEREERLP